MDSGTKIPCSAFASFMCAKKSVLTCSHCPRVLQYREPQADDVSFPTNIMFDRRIVRGNTYAAQIVPADTLLQSNPKASL